ncbi:DUF3048 domain-containing protein [Cellulomonas fimi]|uniref:DUF3048 domain-containing protein n=1 Tax=Cellulomonas fimi (strain ATCC 484 / DSM 20113 / JCM 1341 / CCUG 24087 / LMG 16345 / NBRC 15513 / NCIMB 8980 / NCTC 7547 / NRS-133) TaxID=590998 RepID=F4H187_CELFA|nr:DUF3048 domain-containing protein [Cellulomonas fimi]AEE45058.1 hypothetical protein Celf_0921 [Cellulomonas fimi ATCC 484]VEH28113.1 Putative lipoprotein yerB precursor [Cellulomonas fimi]
MPVAPIRASSRRHAVLLSGALVLALAACSGGPTAPEPETVSQHADVAVAKAAAPAPVVPPRWPLTGQSADAVVERPALAVKIENPKEVRPQTGLDQADVVWEQVVEGGITRFVAVYHSQVPEEIGPIRSVRPMDPAIAAPLRGIVAFSGGQQAFVRELGAAGLQLMSQDGGAAGFYRKKGVAPAPHNVYATPQTFWDAADADHAASPPAQFTFARTAERASAVLAGTPANELEVRMSGYSRPRWTFDTASGTWLRSEGDTPATARSGARLAAANVVALEVRLVDSGTKDPAGNPVPETVLVGSGEGVVVSQGRSLAVTWSKTSTDAVLTLAAPDGSPVALAPGVTWVELVPESSGTITVS